MARLGFAVDCAKSWAAGADTDCPFCGSASTTKTGVKYLLVQARTCGDCGLIFRAPKPDAVANDSFYQESYRQGHTSDVPAPALLEEMRAANFAGHNLSYADRIAFTRRFAAEGRLLDYGASWGYGVFQFNAAGFDAMGFEVSRPRAAFGRAQLGVNLVSDLDALDVGAFDVVHTAHVLEHIPSPAAPLAAIAKALRPGGHLVLAVPNGAGPSALQHGIKWPPLVSEVHVVALTARFLEPTLAKYGLRAILTDDTTDELRMVAVRD
jgi:2-polyprenyl-3-methyl-5-hydroxy-6-metoxy-1,4-benzoquinol methylase